MNKSFLKWAGGKTRALPEIMPVLDDLILEQKTTRFVEPFFGSGVVSLNIQAVDSFLVNDFNKDLIELFKNVKAEDDFILMLSGFFSEKTNNVLYFKEMVTRFNGSTNPLARSMIFLYLNKHCFNGLMRYNKKGFFNTPFGTYENVSFPKEALETFKKKMNLCNFEITSNSYQDVFAKVKKNDLVYCDPPYVNLENAQSFNLYGKDVFGVEDQRNLVELAKQAVKRGAIVVLSNHDTPETQELYKDASSIKTFNVTRSIAASGKKRKPVGEILAVFK